MIDREPTNVTTIKLLSNFASSEELCAAWSKMCKVGNSWNSLQITARDDADYFCVVNYPRPGDFYKPERTIVLKMEEKESSRPYFPPGWVDLERQKFFSVFDRRNSLEWHLGKTYSELLVMGVPKSKTLSSVTSSQDRLEGHIKRLEFLRCLEEGGVAFDLYGRENKFSFTSYRRALPPHRKDDGIFPYKYTFAAESTSADGYFTEKIVDAILGECVCFYWGCPDLESYLDPRAFIRLDLDHPDRSRRIVEEAIATCQWEKRICVIKEVKRKILTEMQVMPVLESIIEGHTGSTSGQPRSREAPPAFAPNIYCINLASSKTRRGRMERRLAHHGLLERTRFIQAVAAAASTDPTDDWQDRASAACTASHLQVMRAIVNDPRAARHGAIVFEDDVLLHNDFAARLRDVQENLPADAAFCSLGYLISSWAAGFSWSGRQPQRRNVCRMLPPAIWGTHGYWISREYAQAVLNRYERPGAEIPSLTERIAHESDGYIAYPPLVLADVIDSTIRGPEGQEFHRTGQLAWIYDDYSACEEGHHDSPLREFLRRRQQSIALCMIVRDEAATIERCLWSARPLIDTWVICDAGSGDSTPELVEEVLGDLPGALHRDFAADLGDLTELARGAADYLLVVDGDMTIELERPVPLLTADAYLLRHTGTLGRSAPRLLRGDRRWSFDRLAQERPASEPTDTRETLDALVVKGHADGAHPAAELERGDVVIYMGQGWETWSPADIETRGLGGSETAAVRLAEQLSRLGYSLAVYGEFEPCVHRDVIFRHWSVFDPAEPRRAFISSRVPEVFDREIAAQSRLLWMHDTDCGPRLTEQRAQAIDHVVTLSGWHTDRVASVYPFLRTKLRQVRNGIEHGYFAGEPPLRARRVVCSSAPDRGLGVLLELWPQILAEVPDAELAYCYYAVYDAVADQQSRVGAHLAEIRELATQPGVVYLGSLTQPQVAELMRSSLVWAHPSYSTLFACPFEETSCISAMEAQAAGCLTVTSRWGALSETVEIGRLVDGEPLSARWRAGFLEAIVEGLTDPDVQTWAQREGPRAVAGYDWRSVAEQFAGLIDAQSPASSTSARRVTRANGRQTIGLAMIVRDEAAVIERCLASVMPLIDHWVICDTGSKDRTTELIETSLRHVPGRLYRDEWHDFARNRTLLMERAAGTADYLLLVDADMTVRSPDALPLLIADAYLVRHDGDIDYVVPRLVRGDRTWRFEGPTHEYLATEGPMQSEILEALVVVHHGDGGMRGEKLERDAQLLEARLDADPEDARSVFYLAQTERDRGNVQRAIELYARRVELGGWDEEVFYAAYQHGILVARADPDAAVALLLSAFERRPTRAEPLYELAQLSRAAGRHEAAHMFATRGLELPYPEDWLFVHRDVYRWGVLFELSIAAYWVGRPDQALEANDRLLETGGLPEEIEASVRENRRHCLAALGRARVGGASATNSVEALTTLVLGAQIGEIRLDVDPDWPCLNPSIATDGDGYRMIVRTANYRLEGNRRVLLDDDRVIRTINYLVLLDGALGLTDVATLVDHSVGPTVYPSPMLGFEDCRLFQVGGEWHAIATVRDRNPHAMSEVALLAIDGSDVSSVLVLPAPEPNGNRMDWMPLVLEDRLHFVVSYSPTIVVVCDTSVGSVELAARHEAPAWAVGFRGGSQGLAVDGGHLFVTRQVCEEGGERTSTHRLVLLDHDLRLSAVSRPFSFLEQPTELCAGLARRGGELVMSFGSGARGACLAVCPEDALMALLI